MGEDLALITPVALGLGARDHLEPPVQTGQFLKVDLDSLVVDGDPVLRRQTLVDH
ncbi:hypothetical protein ACWD3J_39920 [Streptomyces sp. NPDC002755]